MLKYVLLLGSRVLVTEQCGREFGVALQQSVLSIVVQNKRGFKKKKKKLLGPRPSLLFICCLFLGRCVVTGFTHRA
jgi:hypothetical protein